MTPVEKIQTETAINSKKVLAMFILAIAMNMINIAENRMRITH